MKKYLVNFIKARLPLFIIIFAALVVTAFVSAVGLNFVETVKTSYTYSTTFYYFPEDAGVMPLAFVVCIIAMVLPLFNMNYRYSLTKSDMYRQVAQGKKKFRYVEHGITLGFLLTSYTIAFILFVIVAAIKNQIQPLPANTDSETYYRDYFEYLPYLFVYLFTLLFVIGNYFINYLFVSRSNNLLNSIILMVLGQLFLAFFNSVFVELGGTTDYYFAMNPMANSSVTFGPYFLNDKYTGWITVGDKTYDPLNSVNSRGYEEKMLATAASFITFFSIAIVGIVAFLFEKDPSSEWAGKPETNNFHQDLLYNLFVGAPCTVFLFWFMKGWNETSAGSIPFFLLFYVIIYYTLYSVLRRDFRPKGYQVCSMLATTTFMVMLALIMFARIGFTPYP